VPPFSGVGTGAALPPGQELRATREGRARDVPAGAAVRTLHARIASRDTKERASETPPPVVDPDTGVPRGGAKLYVRPMLLGSGQQLGLHVSPEISLLYYVSPTGSYFKGKVSGGLKLHLERRKCRASRGGTGNVKCSGNYAVAMRPLL